ncbi:hypothetical protein [Nocardioides sp. Arc9.136]|uniref:hypothetical protein n=1 Tax=Nocardioides sp. Arc9.136 TaxID=2996826 RepID=UPI002666036F|nr:hypothetical protein [Nocardioides sp. Arc9.136]WKN47130.1 hypothetical protein OSR43_13890 [Nocardioides sp. Arc9.136]
MMQTVLTTLGAVVVALIARGGRERWIRATIREELDLLGHRRLPAAYRVALQKKVDRRLQRYLADPAAALETRVTRLIVALLIIVGLTVTVAAGSLSPAQSVLLGVGTGFAMNLTRPAVAAVLRRRERSNL